KPSRNDSASEARHHSRCGAEPRQRTDSHAPEAVSRGLPGTERMENPPGTSERNDRRRHTAIADPAARRGRTGAADRLPERREPPARARQYSWARNGGSASARRRASATDFPAPHGEPAAVAAGRDRRSGTPVRSAALSVAARSRQSAAVERRID